MGTIEDASIENDVTEDPFEMADDELTHFVDANIKTMQAALSNYTVPSDTELRKLCVKYIPVRLALQKLYSKVKYISLQATAEFKNFEAEAYMATRDKYNNANKDKKLFLSKQEIESAARVLYKDQYAKFEANMALAESKRSFVERLTETWASYQFILGNLVKMYTAEAGATHLDAYATQGMD